MVPLQLTNLNRSLNRLSSPPLSAEEASPKADVAPKADVTPKSVTDEASSNSSNRPTSETRSRRGKRDVSETEVHPTHGRLIEKDPSIGEGALYEDGTYVIKKIDDKNLDIDNPSRAIRSMFYYDLSKLSKIKKIEVEGKIAANRFDIVANDDDLSPTSMDLTGLTLSDQADIPLLTYYDNRLENITFDSDFSLSKIKSVTRMFDTATKLRLSNEQVSQLLRNVAFESNASYNGPIFRKVGVERLDLSSFDNSKWNANDLQPYRYPDGSDRTSATKAVFKDLIGLKEIAFGDKFNFNNYGRKNTPDAFLDTDLSKVERVEFVGDTRHTIGAAKFFADWLTDVKNSNDASHQGVYDNGMYMMTVSEALTMTDTRREIFEQRAVKEKVVYTLGPIPTARPEKPADKVVTETLEPTVEYASDNAKDRGYENRIEGKRGSKTITATYEWDDATNSYKEKVLELVIESAGKTIVTLGTKPTTEVTYQDFNTRYVADPTRTAGEKFTETEGVRGTTTTVTTYSLNTDTGVVTSTKGQPQVVSPTDKVVKVGTKSTTRTTVIPKGTIYRADRDAEFESRTTASEGHDGSATVTTTYTLNEQNGEVTPNVQTSTAEKEDKIIKVGNRKTETVTEPLKTIYVGDESIEFEKKNEIDAGTPKMHTSTFAYDVDSMTGTLSNPREEEFSDIVEVPRKIAVGNKKVVTEPIRVTNRYVGNEEKERGYSNLIERGRDGSRTITTIYAVNEKTGDLLNPTSTETSTPMTRNVYEVGAKPTIVYLKEQNKIVKSTTRVKVDEDTGGLTDITSTETISEDGAKDKVVTEDIEPKVVYEKDDARETGSEDIRTEGGTGTKVTTTTYEVNPETGDLIPTVHEPAITLATNTVVKVAAKDKVEMIRKDGETIERTIRYDVDPVTGEVSSESSDRLIASSVSDGEGNVIQTPTVEIPEYSGGAAPIDAPIHEVPEFNGGVTPNNAPIHELLEFKGGVVPIDAPVQEIPALEAPAIDHRNDVPSIETRQDDKINASKDVDKSDKQLSKRLPDTGQSSDSAGVAGLMLAGLACYLKRKRS